MADAARQPDPGATVAAALTPAAGAALGWAWGAVSILNATATGTGCALAVEAGTRAQWRPAAHVRQQAAGPLVEALRQRLGRLPGWPELAQAPAADLALEVQAAFPPARGLKTSSSVAAAALRSGRTALALPDDDAWVIEEAVAASRAAGVTLTGALDDQVATVLGGCHVTDNAAGRIVRRIPARRWHVAVWVPDATIPKALVAAVDTAPIRRDVEAATEEALAGDVAHAMTQNGAAYSRLYAAAGLPVNERPARVALEHGAEGAGLSGTGPAVAALFRDHVPLPVVPGGHWAWTRAVP